MRCRLPEAAKAPGAAWRGLIALPGCVPERAAAVAARRHSQPAWPCPIGAGMAPGITCGP